MYRKHLLILLLAVAALTSSHAYAAPTGGNKENTVIPVGSGAQEEAFSPLVAGVEAKVNAIEGNGFSNSTGYWSGYWTWDNVNRVWIWTWVWYWTGGGGSTVS